MRCYLAAAETGLLEAQRIVAWNYLNGHGVARDAATAALWFRKAAEQGDADAQFQIGGNVLHWHGRHPQSRRSRQMVPALGRAGRPLCAV